MHRLFFALHKYEFLDFWYWWLLYNDKNQVAKTIFEIQLLVYFSFVSPH